MKKRNIAFAEIIIKKIFYIYFILFQLMFF